MHTLFLLALGQLAAEVMMLALVVGLIFFGAKRLIRLGRDVQGKGEAGHATHSAAETSGVGQDASGALRAAAPTPYPGKGPFGSAGTLY
ncbi:twin-arginine translocase TatA/TatE family subunit [Hymenobacter busanensis]|uniref:Twin-arginine translocase TatA/TatE family subunit n=1 Tax=Hymenobacter busanensis TaxID=2607656 RepID=A0A7L4ZSW1_9BACT|nr:twin-arginine translocase TatA/TatE family subunit [Hymenobacter busanensis]KAA9327657.1 twin-arginine translocase TatA/TatE family subunit [Hymenobacter busanensis]QHJ06003.1 hypothetical protein GUY19_01320 [Hymenobacter busanensis]